MKKFYLFLVMVFALCITGLGQPTNPAPQLLPYSQDFGSTTFTVMPTGWAAWSGVSGATTTSLATAQSSNPSGNATVAAQTAPTTTGGTHGLATGGNARPYVQTSGNATNGVNQLAFAINTTGLTNIVVAYDVESIVAELRTVGIVMQYRVGTSGVWTTVPGTGNPYSQSGGTTGIKANVSVTLPATAENQGTVQLRWATWRGTEAGASSGIAIDNVNVSGTSAGVPDISLSSLNPAIPAGDIALGSTNNVIYRFVLSVVTNSAILNGVTINTSGTYTAITDVTNFKVWYSADNIFNAGTDVLLGNEFASAAGPQVFSPFANQSISAGATGYIFITSDIPCTAGLGNTVIVDAITTADLSFVNGNESGSAFAGGTQTIIAGSPADVTGAAASTGNTASIVSWTNPAGCYDELLIVAASGSANTGIPAGDGSAYTANLIFGSGTALGNGFVVYKGNTSPQTVTGLTNGTQYFFKIYTRSGTTWSSGLEVNATPANVTVATDYFRSKITGDFNSAGTWESSPDGIVWIDASLVPTTAANTVVIRNSHTLTVSTLTTMDQVVIQSGGLLTNTAAITVNDDAGTANDLLIENGGVLALAVTGAPGGAGTLRIQTGGILRVSATGTIQLLQTSRFIYENASVLEYTLTSSPSASGQTYFPNADAVTIPVFRITANIAGTIGGGSATVINGIFEANGTANFSGTGTKTFRNGIRGTGNISQGTAGNFIINGATAELGGTGMLTLGANGLQITSASITFLISTKTVDGGTVTIDGILDAGLNQISGTTGLVINGTLTTANPNGISPAGTLNNSGSKSLGPVSTVVFKAPVPQQFTTGFIYANVSIENGSTKTLDGPVTVMGNLALNNGVVVTTDINVLLLDVTAGFSGGSDLSYVDGPLHRNTNATTPYIFPVGKGGVYKPFDVVPVSATGSSFTGEYFAPNINTTSPACNARLEAYVSNERWVILRVSGNDDASIRLNYVRSASLGNWINGSGPMPDPDNTKGITVANYLNTVPFNCWEVYPEVSSVLVGDVVSGQTATLPLSSFGNFTFGYGPFAALPVQVNYIRGTKQINKNNLSWKVTCLNSPNAVMALERSKDARTFGSIYNLTATADRCLQEFTYADMNPLGGINFYRLKMTDADDRSSYSRVIAISNNDKKFEIVGIAPNPVSSVATLSVYCGSQASMDIVITDMAGKVAGRQAAGLMEGSNLLPLNFDYLPAGSYQLTGIIPGGEKNTIRFIKK